MPSSASSRSAKVDLPDPERPESPMRKGVIVFDTVHERGRLLKNAQLTQRVLGIYDEADWS